MDELIKPEAGLEVKLKIEDNNPPDAEIDEAGYCITCGKFIRIIRDNFQDLKGSYVKGICDHCDKKIKIRWTKKYMQKKDEYAEEPL